MDCSTPGFPVLGQLPELTQTPVHCIGDAIQSSHPLLSPSPAFNLSQHQGLFQWVSSSCQVAKVWEFQLQHQSSQWIFKPGFLFRLTGLISLQSKGLSRVFSNTTVRKHQFFGAQLSLWSNYHICTRLLEKPQLWLYRPLSAKWCLCFLIGLSRLLTAFLPRSKCLLISWLKSPSAAILELTNKTL